LQLKKFEKFDQKLGKQIQARQEMLKKLSAPAQEAYQKWLGMRKEVINLELNSN
jgi:hypothetical protein